jgi:6-phosphogluconolactonase (cycloisomerase 2 family)
VRDDQDGVDGLAFPNSLTISPDGNSLYAAGRDDDAVAVFSRDSETGFLTFVEVQRDGVGGVDGLNGPRSVTVSPDGKLVYVTGADDDAVAVFSRNSTTSGLTYLGAHLDGVGGVDGLNGAVSIAASPDGKHIYVASFNANALATFSVEQ